MMTMKKLMILTFILAVGFSCKNKSTNPESQAVSFTYQTSSCISLVTNIRSSVDSIFTYTFTGPLVLDFSVSANCCPDSNRFVLSYAIPNDTIIVTVADTAQSLCRCVCTYMAHVVIAGLQQNRYVVRCTTVNLQGNESTIHNVDVYRQMAS